MIWRYMMVVAATYGITLMLLSGDVQLTKEWTADYLHLYNQCLHKTTLKGHKVERAMEICRPQVERQMEDRYD